MTASDGFTPTYEVAEIDRQAEQIRQYSRSIKADLCRPAAGMLSRPYLSAGLGATYPDLTDWDAVWAGAAYLIDGDRQPLRDSMVNFLEHITPSGKGQRRIGKDGYSAPPYQIRPFLATGCFVLSRETGDLDWMGPYGLDALENYLLYRHTNNTGREGLLTWFHIDEGFGDNGTGNWAWEANSVEAVDLNSQMVLEHTAFAWLAAKAGDDRRADRHRFYAQRLTDSINRLLWDETDEFYYSLYIPPRRYDRSTPIKAIYSANLWPLWLGLVPQQRAEAIIGRYVLSPDHFWSQWGLRTLSRSERHYNNAPRGINMPTGYKAFQGPAIETATCSNVQGPIFSFVNFFGGSYLSRYGFTEYAKELAARTVRLHAESLDEHGVFYENYDAETGAAMTAPGIASWCLMVPQMWQDAQTGNDWWLRDLALPQPR